VWSASSSPVLAYMDIDLSTDLDALLPLVAPLVSGHSDLAIGTRLARGAQVVRGARREAISRSYNLLVRTALGTGFSDAQCGFKAIRADVARLLLPLVEDQAWFFDTELLALAEHNGFRIHEVPVDWVDDPDSRVHVVDTAVQDLKGVWRVLGAVADGRAALPDGRGPRCAVPALGVVDQAVRFASIGLVSTVAGTVLFLLLVPALGPVAANAVAFVLCAVANTAANRRFTFALRGRGGRRRHWRGSLALGSAPLAVSTVVLLGLGAAGVGSAGLLAVALAVTNAVLAAGKFAVLRRWVYRRADAAGARAGGASMAGR
jgi:putative flippase GtrA